jgi:replicative DNA helicase
MQESKNTIRNEYVNDLDLIFIKHCIETPYVISETKLTIDHLEDVLAKIIFQMMVKTINDKNVFLPAVDLNPLFLDKDRLEKFSHFMHPIELTTVDKLILDFRGMNSDLSVKDIEQTIVDRYNREQLKRIGKKILIQSEDSSKSVKDILREYGYRIDTLLDAASSTRKIISSSDIFQKEVAYLEDDSLTTYSSTGTIIDLVNGGLNAPALIFFVAPPKEGKSLCLYNSAINSLIEGKVTVFATVEISAEEASRKLLSIYTGIPFSAINKKQLTPEQKEEYLSKVKEFQEMTKDKLFIIDDSEGLSPKDILTYCRHLKRAGIVVEDIFIDYLQLLTPNNPNLDRVSALSVMSQDLRKLSQQTGSRVFSAQQLHGSSSSKEFEDITFDDIYYCKTLAQDATYTIVIRNTKLPDGSHLFRSRFLPSRQQWDANIYTFPDYRPETLSLGSPQPYIETVQVEDYTNILVRNAEDMLGMGVDWND